MSATPVSGDRVGPYVLERAASAGATGTVWRARSKESGEGVALKILQPLTAEDFARFREEARILEGIQHPGIVRYRDHSEDRTTPWLAMEWVAGPTLEEWRRASGAAMQGDALRVFAELAEALGHLHGCGVVHRDLKPQNVVLRGGDAPVLVDLGFAAPTALGGRRETLTPAGEVVGTPAFMAPEQARGDVVDSRADLYAFGSMLYDHLTGTTPNEVSESFGGPDRPPSEWLPPPETEIQEPLRRLIHRLVERDPRRRMPDAREVVRVLSALRGAPDPRSAPPAAAELHRADFVERPEQQERLRQAILRAPDRRGRPVLVAGEAGVGKTRLVAEAAKTAIRRRYRVVRCACDPAGLDGPGSGLRDLYQAALDVVMGPVQVGADREWAAHAGSLARLHPGFGPLSTPERDAQSPDGTRARLVEASLAALRIVSASAPLLVVVDDLQWADDTTLDVVEALALRPDAAGATCLVATVRKEESSDRTTALLQSEAVENLRLEAMEREQVARMVAGMLGWPEAPPSITDFLYRQAGGIPFYVGESLRLAVEQGILTRGAGERWMLAADALRTLGEQRLATPSSLDAVVARRLAALSPPAHACIQVIAVLGSPCVPKDLAGSGLSDATLEAGVAELLERRILFPAEQGALRLAHHRFREVAYAELDRPVREKLHETAAQLLEERTGHDPDAARAAVAAHYLAAGNAPRALMHAVPAVERAMAMGSYREARNLLRSLLEACPGLGVPTPLWARWLRLQGEACLATADLDGCLHYSLAAIDKLRARASSSASDGSGSGLPPAVASPAEAEVELALSSGQAATTFLYQRRVVEGVTNALRATRAARRARRPELAVLAQSQLAFILGVSRSERLARRFFAQCEAHAARVAPRQGIASVYFRAMYEMGEGHHDAALAHVTRAIEWAERSGDVHEQEIARTIRGNTLMYSGQAAASAAEFDQVAALASKRMNDQHLGWALALKGRALLEVGLDEKAHGLLERSYDVVQVVADEAGGAMCRGLYARALLSIGDVDRALDVANELWARLPERVPIPLGQCIDAYLSLAEVFLAVAERSGSAADRARSREAVWMLAKFAFLFPFARPAATRLAAENALVRSPAANERLWRHAAREARRRTMPFEERRILRAWSIGKPLPETDSRPEADPKRERLWSLERLWRSEREEIETRCK